MDGSWLNFFYCLIALSRRKIVWLTWAGYRIGWVRIQAEQLRQTTWNCVGLAGLVGPVLKIHLRESTCEKMQFVYKVQINDPDIVCHFYSVIVTYLLLVVLITYAFILDNFLSVIFYQNLFRKCDEHWNIKERKF